MALSSCVSERSGGAVLQVHVQPKASRSEFGGMHGGALKLRLTAPPVEGEANKECVRFLAKVLGVAKSGIEITHGHKSRDKTLFIHGLSGAKVQEALERAGAFDAS